MVRDGLMNAEGALLKISSQMPLEVKRDKATILIDNSGSLERTQKQVDTMMNNAFYLPYYYAHKKGNSLSSLVSSCVWALSWIPAMITWSILTVINWVY